MFSFSYRTNTYIRYQGPNLNGQNIEPDLWGLQGLAGPWASVGLGPGAGRGIGPGACQSQRPAGALGLASGACQGLGTGPGLGLDSGLKIQAGVLYDAAIQKQSLK